MSDPLALIPLMTLCYISLPLTYIHQIRKTDLESPEWKAKYLGAYYNTQKVVCSQVRHDTYAVVRFITHSIRARTPARIDILTKPGKNAVMGASCAEGTD